MNTDKPVVKEAGNVPAIVPEDDLIESIYPLRRGQINSTQYHSNALRVCGEM